jgi:putative beta-lysine N-acetyltransferase
MKRDKIAIIGNSIIQHGYFNDRIYLIKINPGDVKKIFFYITALQTMFFYSKIVMKIPKTLQSFFTVKDSKIEAKIPDFYSPGNDAIFLSRFYKPSRAFDEKCTERCTTIYKSLHGSVASTVQTDNPSLVIRKATPDDIPSICSLYQRSFETYPFPIQDPGYISSSMNNGTTFFVGEIDNVIIAAGSCDMDHEVSAVEITDLAVDDTFRGYGISKKLLVAMEHEMKRKKIRTAYTICRSLPLPVNRLFARNEYLLGGTLINNTNICGSLESMNVWYKSLV